MMLPVASGYRSGRSELFTKRTSPIFDPVGAVEIAAILAISGLLQSDRAARTLDQNAADKASPGFMKKLMPGSSYLEGSGIDRPERN
ncbi:MAG: hypothetical protein R2682_00800 [Pyrinomonadaceae bacterium]